MKTVKKRANSQKDSHSCLDHAHSSPEKAFESALARLKESGLKLTLPRQSLLKSILEFDGPFSAEDLFQAVSRTGTVRSPRSSLDLVTVYRSLSTFSELRLLSQVDLGDGVLRYEWRDPEGSHHHHVICTECKKIEPIQICQAAGQIQIQEKSLLKQGYSRLTHRLEFFGLCPDCTQRHGLL